MTIQLLDSNGIWINSAFTSFLVVKKYAGKEIKDHVYNKKGIRIFRKGRNITIYRYIQKWKL